MMMKLREIEIDGQGRGERNGKRSGERERNVKSARKI